MVVTLLRGIRWTLIAVLSIFVFYVLYFGLTGVVGGLLKERPPIEHLLGVFTFVLMVGVLALIPGIMVHSLIVKKLNGFASCVGWMLGFGGFLALLSWPNRLRLFELWNAAESLPLLIRGLGGLVISLVLLVLPFWFLSRVIKFTNEWLYPKVFKPLEEKL